MENFLSLVAIMDSCKGATRDGETRADKLVGKDKSLQREARFKETSVSQPMQEKRKANGSE